MARVRQHPSPSDRWTLAHDAAVEQVVVFDASLRTAAELVRVSDRERGAPLRR